MIILLSSSLFECYFFPMKPKISIVFFFITGTFGSTSGGTLFSSNTGTTDLFGKNQTAPAFGAPAATQSTGFGFSAPTTSNMFGTNTAQVRPFGGMDYFHIPMGDVIYFQK